MTSLCLIFICEIGTNLIKNVMFVVGLATGWEVEQTEAICRMAAIDIVVDIGN